MTLIVKIYMLISLFFLTVNFSRHLRNSGGGVFIPPVDVSNIVKPREQTTEELEVRVQI